MGGRGSKSGLTARPRVTPAPPQAFQVQQQPPQIQVTPQQAQQANNAAFSDTDNSPFHDLYNGAQYFQRQNLTIDQVTATVQYLRLNGDSNNPYSMSQNLNEKMRQNAEAGKPLTDGLTANERFVLKHMMGAMHNMGYNVNLTRYDHGEIVNKLLAQNGLPNADFTKIPVSQLQKMLVGTTYNEERLVSTSYNNFKNAPQSTKDVFMNRAVKFEYRTKAGAQVMMPGNGPGGKIGEVVLAPSQGRSNFRIVGIREDTGTKVRQKNTTWLSSQNQIVFTVEVD